MVVCGLGDRRDPGSKPNSTKEPPGYVDHICRGSDYPLG
ncbi:hypothetical protein AVEN_7979-1, partial [Araneus ventricosus]